MKRFWSAVAIEAGGDGFGLSLDGRPVRTPARAALRLPTRAVAEAAAAEWAAQGETVDPLSMPLTRAANAAIDRVIPERAAVASGLAAYAETDLLCYRAGYPPALAERQAAAWDPLLAWAETRYGARLAVTVGVVPVPQEGAALARLAAAVEAEDAWALTALSDLVTLSGSLVLALAVREGAVAAEDGWDRSRIDEAWNIAEWGADAEAAAVAARRREDFLSAARLLTLLGR